MNRAAQRCIADLDTALARTGEVSINDRALFTDAPDGDQVAFYCENVPAKVVNAQPQEIIAVTGNQDSAIIISPTRLAARQWPVPPRKDDRVWIIEASGRELVGNIESVIEQRVGGAVVRYELKTRS